MLSVITGILYFPWQRQDIEEPNASFSLFQKTGKNIGEHGAQPETCPPVLKTGR